MESTNNHMVVVGLNGALQKRFLLPDRQILVPGNVHRASKIDFGVGGKGQDVAIALHCLLRSQFSSSSNNEESNPIRLLQFLGKGFAGDLVYNLLQDRLGETSMGLTVKTSSELRTCTSIIASDETTELVEPSGRICEDELEELVSRLPKTAVRSICIMGSMPPGCPEDTYARIYEKIVGPTTVCVVDSLAGICSLLETISRPNHSVGPTVLKVNASELCKLAGTSKGSSETGGITLDELIDAIRGFLSKYPVTILEGSPEAPRLTGVVGLAITDGKHDAYFVAMRQNEKKLDTPTLSSLVVPSFRVLKMPIPQLKIGLDGDSRPLYPIGAGDAVAAGTISAWASLAASDCRDSIPSFHPILSETSLNLLEEFQRNLQFSNRNEFSVPKVHSDAAAAFAFGLACGSASCLQEENSVLDVADVNTLFQAMMTRQSPVLVHTS